MQYAKARIKESFLKLLEEHPLSKITVRSIVEDCGVNRNTFYYYFEDIPSLLVEITQEEIDRIANEHGAIDNLEDGLLEAIQFAVKHRRAAFHIYHSENRDIYERYIWKICDYIIQTYFDTAFPDRDVSPEDEALIKEYYKSLSYGLLVNWLENGLKSDITASISRLSRLLQGQTAELFRRSREI